MANELFNVAGKVVVMTGGAGVLGKGISKYLAAQGAKMVVLDRSEEAGKALVDEIVAQGHEATFLYTDVMNKEVLEQRNDSHSQIIKQKTITKIYPHEPTSYQTD